jgi:hypothetical protein
VEKPTPIAKAFLLVAEKEVVLHGETWFFHAGPALDLYSVAVHGLKSRATKEGGIPHQIR